MMTLILLFSILACILALAAILLMLGLKKSMAGLHTEDAGEALRRELLPMEEHLRREVRAAGQESVTLTQNNIRALGETFVGAADRTQAMQDKRLTELTEQLNRQSVELRRSVGDSIHGFDERFAAFSQQNAQSLSDIRESVERRLKDLQADNAKQLDRMRETVDEKLQKTLDERLNQSFSVVSERLEQVYRGLGEMQTLASGVGDLKKVLSNVKTRGIFGEIQLGAILEEILSPEQYETNVVTRKGSQNPVEFAVRLPGSDGETVYLPIDAKFPMDAYAHVREAYDTGDPAVLSAAKRNLEAAVKSFARDIRDKYVNPPATTDFGIMFLPVESLYAEVVSCGLVEVLQRDYKVSVAGPTTMAALLNSLQMGFRTLAIQKRSGEVWKVLGAVKTEFDRFGDVLEATQKRLEQTSSELDKLVGVRTRQIRSKLRTVTAMPEGETAALLGGEEE
ncbi:MAG: DNA recombination protein RmuC [Ruminococcaceae bacterium]|nr:DNA recombination protein RmuC [Oscillospiraceae bacterium]